MVTAPFDISVKATELPYQLHDIVTADPQWHITDYIGASDYGSSDFLERSNYETMMKDLRAVADQVEGSVEGRGYEHSIQPPDASWAEYCGRIVYKTALTDEELKRLYAERIYSKYDYSLPELPDPEPILDKLLDFCSDLHGYPVLDEEDLSQREDEAIDEELRDAKPSWIKQFTPTQLWRIRLFLDGANDWQESRDRDKLPDCEEKYQVDFESGECHVRWNRDEPNIYLEECVKYACRQLGYYPRNRRRR